jgi:photosystem II stability/assembly factor-like uncharacterized protein
MKLHFIAFSVFIVLSNACMQTARAQWVQTNGPFGRTVFSLAVSGSNIFAGTDSGVFLSTNYGTNWTAVNSGLTNTDVRALAVIDSNIFAGTYGGVFLSTDTGTSWTTVNSGLGANTHVYSFGVSGSNIFVATDSRGVLFSTNIGTSWTQVKGFVNPYTVSLAVSGSNILVGTYGGVFLSTDTGTSWTQVTTGLAESYLVYSFAFSDSNIFAGTEKGIILSTDTGTSWTAVNSDLPVNTHVYSFGVSGSSIFAGTDSGVFLSTDNGANWAAINSCLMYTDIRSLAVIDSNIFAGTYGGGVWRMPLSETTAIINHKLQRETSDFHIRPPSHTSPFVTVAFSLPQSEHITVKTYDLSGRTIAVLVNKSLGSGSHRITWNTQNMSSGCYMIKLQSGSYSFVKNFSIIR